MRNIFKVNNKDTKKLNIVFLLLTLNIFTPFSRDSIIDFEQVNVTKVLILLSFVTFKRLNYDTVMVPCNFLQYVDVVAGPLLVNHLSANPTKWSNTLNSSAGLS